MTGLKQLNRNRAKILADVEQTVLGEFAEQDLEMLLGEALYLERQRIRRLRSWRLDKLFIQSRVRADAALWSSVKPKILSAVSESDRKAVLGQVVHHYAEEIGGHFNPLVYQFATRAVPWGFNWFLNAVSVKHFLPWGMSQAIEDRIQIIGETEHLKQLSKRGTILLVPTHMSNLDSILIGYVVYRLGLPPFAYGGGLNLFTNPVLSFFMTGLGAYKVDRAKNNLIYKSTLKRYSTEILKRGIHSVFFPGGGRIRSGAIESKLKLGLLGTAQQAQLEKLMQNHPQPNVYIVPMNTSYHFVLEASSLIEQYLHEQGRFRFVPPKFDSILPAAGVARFFNRLFSSKTTVTVRIGKPMDIFGNPVDDEGRSMGPNGTTIDPSAWFTTDGVLGAQPQRDAEYTRILGDRIVDSFYASNTVLTSHLVAFVLFRVIVRKHPELDLFRLLRLTPSQCAVPLSEFYHEAEAFALRIRKAADLGELHASPEISTMKVEEWVADGLRNLGLMHDVRVALIDDKVITTEDMNLLYYYRNRLSGYGRAKPFRGKTDDKGILA